MTTTTVPQDARHQPLSQADKLTQDAAEASRIRKLSTHPDVIALRVEKVRTQVDRLMWTGLLLGLAFTMVNVQTFAAAGAAIWSLPWLAAWLLDPMVSLVLVAVLRAEQITARYQVEMRTETLGPWVRRTKLFAFLATYVMNTWQSWSHLHVSGIVLHSVPPVMVYLAAETGPILRDRLTEAVVRAARLVPGATDTTVNTRPSTQDSNADTLTNTPSAPVADQRAPRSRKPAAQKATKPRRPSRYEYLDRVRTAHQPGIVVTPAWVREVVPDISRGTSKVVSDLLNAELDTPHITTDTTAVDLPGRAA
ncbi:hypothetical protein [Actinophytocola xanthii]|uniref:DUF2637 domain-containing protein n=1 Tax=Actinophytocola xanthii TaxID=1912961 RepID=A0A1Q8CC24_9PSEU|nr:hypothetical protein [Actinophytocola xanthii]OLF11872.1 hypothetical protein BU204_29960 [Actinophytocola xanthii]